MLKFLIIFKYLNIYLSQLWIIKLKTSLQILLYLNYRFINFQIYVTFAHY